MPCKWTLSAMPEIRGRIGTRTPAFFLDLDGTLAPFAARPESVCIPQATRDVLDRLVLTHLVCFVSGRALQDLRSRVGIAPAFYAANHGREIVGPAERGVALEVGVEYRGELAAAATELERRLASVPGVVVEAKGLSVAVHYRLVEAGEHPMIERTVAAVAASFPSLMRTSGKMVLELRPPGQWDKGTAMLWLLDRLALSQADVCPVCLGDDLTDEDMFLAARGWGLNVMVGRPDRPTYADFWLSDSAESAFFLNAFAPET